MEQSGTPSRLSNFVSLPGTGRIEKVMGVSHTYRLEEQQTGGALACIEVMVPPGHGIPLHMHQIEDETFYVLDGVIEISGDDLPGSARLPQGALFFGPRGRMHAFINPTDTMSRMLVLMTPGGNMQRMFGELAALTAHSEGLPKPEAVMTLCAKYDIIFAPPPA